MKEKFYKKKLSVFIAAFLASLCYVLIPASAKASVTITGGDGFIPIIYKTKVFNIFHHRVPSGNPNNPNYDINCIDTVTQAICPNYPRYFSSTLGSSGRLDTGTAGIADILTPNMPQAVIQGSQLFYPALRSGDNGMGCFDLDNGTNCGYFALGSLTNTGGFDPEHMEGIERVGNRLFGIGDDINFYCLDITLPSTPVACAGQPYAVNTGITAQMPTSAWGRASRQVIGTKIYFLVNYNFNNPKADARISCFDTNTNDRCAGWSSLEVLPGSFAQSYSLTLFEFPNTSGQSTSICTAQLDVNPVQCWDLNSQLTVSPPPGLFSNIGAAQPVTVAEELPIGNKSYFALFSVINFQGATASQGMAACYDFSIQARCTGFGSGGIKKWDGSDGGIPVNGGNTRDYGYAANGICMFGLGDAGVLWSFDRDTGLVPAGNLSCTFSSVPTLPNTGVGIGKQNKWWLITSTILISSGVLAYAVVKKYKWFTS